METTLRPMSLGELLDRTAQLYRTHFLLFVGISAVYAGVLLVLNLLQIGLTELLKAMHMGGQQLWVTFGFLLLILPVTVIAAGAAVAANNRAVAWVNVGQPATIRGAYKSILPRLWSYLWLMFLTTVIILTPFIVIYGGFLLFMWKYGAFNLAKTQKADPYAVMVIGGVSILFFILIVAWIVYAILMGLRYSLAVPASVVEHRAEQGLARQNLSAGADDFVHSTRACGDLSGLLHSGGLQEPHGTARLGTDSAAVCGLFDEQLYWSHVRDRPHAFLL